VEPELRSGRQAGAWAGQLNCSTWNTCTNVLVHYPVPLPPRVGVDNCFEFSDMTKWPRAKIRFQMAYWQK
jgi:hypothetical protein